MKNKIALAELRQMLDYAPSTGRFTWKIGCRRGAEAGSVGARRYRTIKVKRVAYLAHQLAWIWMTGEEPRFQIDHMNGDHYDNRFENLRDVDQKQNRQNLRGATARSKTGVLGISPSRGRFMAAIKVNGRSKFLGRFDTEEQAHEAYLSAKRELHPGCTL